MFTPRPFVSLLLVGMFGATFLASGGGISFQMRGPGGEALITESSPQTAEANRLRTTSAVHATEDSKSSGSLSVNTLVRRHKPQVDNDVPSTNNDESHPVKRLAVVEERLKNRHDANQE